MLEREQKQEVPQYTTGKRRGGRPVETATEQGMIPTSPKKTKLHPPSISAHRAKCDEQQ